MAELPFGVNVPGPLKVQLKFKPEIELPYWSIPCAVNDHVSLGFNVSDVGLSTTCDNGPGCSAIETVWVSPPLLTRRPAGNKPALVPAVKRTVFVSMVAIVPTGVPLTVHSRELVGIRFPKTSVTVAENICCDATMIDALAGATVIVYGTSGVIVKSAVRVMPFAPPTFTRTRPKNAPAVVLAVNSVGFPAAGKTVAIELFRVLQLKTVPGIIFP